ncbi:hypothetical protein Lmac_2659 [Legionella maceachernii]|uniref:Uncharacterized protein n=1 Tax=Legionella maceachernii TaxID=466 RepID=A0A0W0VWT0_9GAMM|nr:hypothetical protein Lmac_2659 [Legionella maceachernii]SJZ62953.1 hypothetical protein SAMN02745128_00650 [Legionella maceachernii]SUP01009.1 Uncharacterised protein [Legionella maceachernii]
MTKASNPFYSVSTPRAWEQLVRLSHFYQSKCKKSESLGFLKLSLRKYLVLLLQN